MHPKCHLAALVLLFALISASGANGTFTVDEVRTSREEPKAGSTFKVMCTIKSDDGTGPDLVEVSSDGARSTMYPTIDVIDWYEGVAYEGNLRLEGPGNHTLTISIKKGTSTETFMQNITLVEEDEGPDGGTILGLPRWYCALSIVIVTIFIMFLTFAYFKGRSIQRERKREVVIPNDFCSSCGGSLSPSDTVCPSCHKRISGKIEVCGICKTMVPPGASKCPSCRTVLDVGGSG